MNLRKIGQVVVDADFTAPFTVPVSAAKTKVGEARQTREMIKNARALVKSMDPAVLAQFQAMFAQADEVEVEEVVEAPVVETRAARRARRIASAAS